MILSRKELGKLIKKARKLKSEDIGRLYTQKMLATDLGKSQSYIGDIESGRTYPNFVLLAQISEACGVSISFFENDTDLDDHIDRFLKNQLFDVGEKELYTLKNILKKDSSLYIESNSEVASNSEEPSEMSSNSEIDPNSKTDKEYNYIFKHCVKDYIDNLLTNLSKTPENSIEFMMRQSSISNSLGLDTNKLNDIEKDNLISDVLNHLKLLSYKYRK